MPSGSIARRWAKALFDLGEENRNRVAVVREVQRAAEAWSASAELRQAMTNPLLPEEARRGLWDSVVRKIGASRHVKSFLYLLRDKSRLPELPGIARELQALSDRREGRVRAEVISAARVGEDVVARLRAVLQKTTGKAVVVTQREDPELIGGVVTRVGDLMFDGSVRTRLERIREGMLGRG